MALQRATFITYGNDEACASTKEFIEGSGIILDVRNLDEKPFTYDELSHLIGYLSLSHFLNAASPAYSKQNLDKELPPRREVLRMMVEDHTLLRRPIIQAARLITVGCDHQKISEMLQISNNNNGDSGGDERSHSTAGNNRSQQQHHQQQQQQHGNSRRDRRRQQHSSANK